MIDKQGFTLENFEGTLDLLLYLVRKHELDIGEVPLKEITSQFLKRLSSESFETGGEFLLHTASLLLLKSQALLPGESPKEESADPRLEMLRHVIDYCHLKEKAKDLSAKEMNTPPHFPRGKIENIPEAEATSGIDHLSLQDLVAHLDRALTRNQTKTVQREKWSTEEAHKELQEALPASLEEIFSADKHRGHLIVLFLAILEMMKHQQIKIEAGQCRKS